MAKADDLIRPAKGLSRLGALYPAAIASTFVLTKYLDEGIPSTLAVRAVTVAALLGGSLALIGAVVLQETPRGALLGLILVGLIVTIHQPVVATLLLAAAALVVMDRWSAARTGRTDPADVRMLHRWFGWFSVVLLTTTLAQFAIRGQVVAPPLVPPSRRHRRSRVRTYSSSCSTGIRVTTCSERRSGSITARSRPASRRSDSRSKDRAARTTRLQT